MNALQELKKWIAEITEIALLLVALGVTVEILFGGKVPFFGQVITNLTALIGTLGENGLVGVLAIGVIFFLFHRRRAVAEHHHG